VGVRGVRVRVLDFGLARAAEDDPLTRSGAAVGTPAYMSPEQADGLDLDGRTDLFSLGCVLYRMTTGEAPFKGPTLTAVLNGVAQLPRPQPDGPAPPGPKDPLPPLAVKRLDIRVWKKQDTTNSLRVDDPRALPLRAGDYLRVEAELNRPAYLYLLYLDARGEA